jgi:hypothetical protein
MRRATSKIGEKSEEVAGEDTIRTRERRENIPRKPKQEKRFTNHREDDAFAFL